MFDGNRHTISHFRFAAGVDLSDEGQSQRCAGLFGYADDPNAEIRNVRLIDPYIDTPGEWYVGALVRTLKSGTVSACSVVGGTITGMRVVGGLVGSNDGVMMQCYAATTVVGETRVAGLTGQNAGVLTDCYATASVSGGGGDLGGQNTYLPKLSSQPQNRTMEPTLGVCS